MVKCTGVADEDAHELDASPILSDGEEEGVVLNGLLVELLLESEVSLEADLKEDGGAILAVEEVEVRCGSAGTPRAEMISGVAHAFDNPHRGHASEVTSLYMYTGLPLYIWPYRNHILFMSFLGDSRM